LRNHGGNFNSQNHANEVIDFGTTSIDWPGHILYGHLGDAVWHSTHSDKTLCSHGYHAIDRYYHARSNKVHD
jgi:hypothetical protein